MSALAFEPADRLDLEALTALWNRAYEGYFVPISLTAAGVRRHLNWGGIDLALSRVARLDGAPVGVSFAAVRDGRGWIGGFGVAVEARRQGVATRLAQAQCEVLDAAGVGETRLEVIDVNPARAVYEAVGFRVARRLLSYEGQADGEDELQPLDADGLAEAHARLNAGRTPTWRRELASLQALVGAGDAAAFALGEAAYAVIAGPGGMIDAAAVDAAAAGRLLGAVTHRFGGFRLVDEPEDTPLGEALGVREPFISQFEMGR